MTDHQNGQNGADEAPEEVNLAAFTDEERAALGPLQPVMRDIVGASIQRDESGGSTIRVFRLVSSHIAASVGYWAARAFGREDDLEPLGNMLLRDFKDGFEGGIAQAEKKEGEKDG